MALRGIVLPEWKKSRWNTTVLQGLSKTDKVPHIQRQLSVAAGLILRHSAEDLYEVRAFAVGALGIYWGALENIAGERSHTFSISPSLEEAGVSLSMACVGLDQYQLATRAEERQLGLQRAIGLVAGSTTYLHNRDWNSLAPAAPSCTASSN